jgi:lipopolysaccharide biosynthesis regulator YciM
MIWGISVVFFNNPSKSQNDRIFANYYRTYKMDNKLVYRVPSNNDYGIAYDQYREGNYREAINEFEGIIRHDTTRITACFLLGISFIEVQNYSEAIKNLAYVIDQNSGIIQQAEWYLALCYIKTRKTAQANLMLNRIIDENNCYKQLASEILKKIKS